MKAIAANRSLSRVACIMSVTAWMCVSALVPLSGQEASAQKSSAQESSVQEPNAVKSASAATTSSAKTF